MFTHEKFEAYKLAIDFTAIALQLIDELPAGHATLRDQLRRAAISIPLNIAEGTGKNSKADRLRFYAVARGSAMECAAICDVVRLLDARFQARIELAKAKLKSVVNILPSICSGK
jgi:four helix bundle protein